MMHFRDSTKNKISMILFLLIFSNANALDLPPIPPSLSTATACEVGLSGVVTAEEWSAILNKNPTAAEAEMLFKQVKLANQKVASLIDYSYVQAVFADPEMSFFQNRFVQYMKKFSYARGVKSVLTKLLTNEVPSSSIEKRIDDFLNPNWTQDRATVLRRVLGENTIEEVRELVYGGVDPLNPTPESLVGKYLQESGARKVIRTFRGAARKNTKDTQSQRLVVSVSSETWPIYKKYFTKINFLIHNHAPHQGTLQIASNGKTGSYGKLDQEFIFPQTGSVLPHLLLSTTEGQRLQLYSKLAAFGNSYSNYPWLRGGYCPTSGYGSCTHWVGNLPLGDEWVEELKFPGSVDQHADATVPKGDQIGAVSEKWMNNLSLVNGNNNPNNQQNYSFISNQNRAVTVTAEQLELIRRVWRTPSRMQLSELLGPKELKANLRGEYANPGWVAIRLTAHVSSERMPIIFLAVDDAQKIIKANFDTQISAF